MRSKTRKPHGTFWHWAGHRIGLTSSAEYIHPILDMRNASKKQNADEPSIAPPWVDRNWELIEAEPPPYSTDRRKRAVLCVGMGHTDGESYALRSSKYLFPAAAIQMSIDQRERHIIGQRSSTSRMP